MRKHRKLKSIIKTAGPIHDTVTGYDFREDKPLTPLRSIRAKCIECCAGNTASVRGCHIYDCPLWPFRLGKNPKRKGIGGKGGFEKGHRPNSSRASAENTNAEG